MSKITITVTIPSGDTCAGCRHQSMGNDGCLLFKEIRSRRDGEYVKCALCKEAANGD